MLKTVRVTCTHCIWQDYTGHVPTSLWERLALRTDSEVLRTPPSPYAAVKTAPPISPAA
jgi:hypothetical protein